MARVAFVNFFVVAAGLFGPASTSRDRSAVSHRVRGPESRKRELAGLLQKLKTRHSTQSTQGRQHARGPQGARGPPHPGDQQKLRSLLGASRAGGGQGPAGLLGARGAQAAQGAQHVDRVRFLMGDRSRTQQGQGATTTTAQALDVPALPDQISKKYWSNANEVLDIAGYSTPIPATYYVNAPPATPAPQAWQKVMENPAQPLETKLGAVVMDSLVGRPTQTPPPTQAATSMEFIENCPMVLFENKIYIKAATCNETFGTWLDTSPSWEATHFGKPREVLRWAPSGFGGLRLGVDSTITGNGSVLFAAFQESFSLYKYVFSVLNCMGVERWTIHEEVDKVDSMGNVPTTVELSDIQDNGPQYFMKYVIRNPTGAVAAQSNLFKEGANQVIFTEVINGKATGKVLATANRIGLWTAKGWLTCTNQRRGWEVEFPMAAESDSIATVQDIRVALAGAMNLLAYRDENRAPDGLNNMGDAKQRWYFLGGVLMLIVILVLLCNCCMVYFASGIKEKLSKTFWDCEGAFLPKRPHNHMKQKLHAAW